MWKDYSVSHTCRYCRQRPAFLKTTDTLQSKASIAEHTAKMPLATHAVIGYIIDAWTPNRGASGNMQKLCSDVLRFDERSMRGHVCKAHGSVSFLVGQFTYQLKGDMPKRCAQHPVLARCAPHCGRKEGEICQKDSHTCVLLTFASCML